MYLIVALVDFPVLLHNFQIVGKDLWRDGVLEPMLERTFNSDLLIFIMCHCTLDTNPSKSGHLLFGRGLDDTIGALMRLGPLGR